MRRLIIAVLLASSVAVPAMAQDHGLGGRDPDRETRVEASEQRQQAREARRAQRAERQAEAAAPRQMERQRSDRGTWERSGFDSRRVERDAARSAQVSPYDDNGQVLSQQRDITPVRNRSILGQVVEQDRARQGQVAVQGEQHRDRRRGGHGGYHRDVNREHRDLHASDPSKREHRGWHRDVSRQHDRRHSSWNNGWRSDRSFDWRDYRHRNRSLFRLGNYWDPYGSRYRRFSIGFSLFPNYYSQNHWLDDPWQYRLPPAYGPYRWVRYYGDALLVNIYTGQVVDVEYNVFW